MSHVDYQSSIGPPKGSFGSIFLKSSGFRTLVTEGASLVADLALYLDGGAGPDRASLDAHLQAAFALETMRLSSRLVHISSWLIVHDAVAAGDMALDEARQRRAARPFITVPVACGADTLARLPAAFQLLVERSIQLQNRILRLDAGMDGSPGQLAERRGPVGDLVRTLELAFVASARN